MKLRYLTFLAIGLITAASANAGKLDAGAQRIVEGLETAATARLFTTFQENNQTRVHVFIDADATAVPGLRNLGARLRAVLPNGLMTADVPVAALRGLAAAPGVRTISLAGRVEKRMDVAIGPIGINVPSPPTVSGLDGEGVLIGVIDSGIDHTHPDFYDSDDSDRNSRILKIWDHTVDPADVGGGAFQSPSPYKYGTVFQGACLGNLANPCPTTDKDGHGTHVTGTIAGSGLGDIDHQDTSTSMLTGFRGVAYASEILVVKFDFENVKGRNSAANIVDGVDWLMKEAADKPIAINMSLGSDYGSHDGDAPDERGIDALTGSGKIVVVAAGNAARSDSSSNIARWGAPLHGQIKLGSDDGSDDAMEVKVPAYSAIPGENNDYFFMDGWYAGNVSFRVVVKTPRGAEYPPNFGGRYRNLWSTGGSSGGFCTDEGFIYVANLPGAQTFWESTNSANNLYVEISDYRSATCPSGEVAVGTWTVELVEASSTGPVLDGWIGNSDSLNLATYSFDGLPSNNKMTIGSPATAKTVISVGAYQTKNCWKAKNWLSSTTPSGVFEQCYGVAPVDYYDPFTPEGLAFFSSRGPSRDGRTQPFISAPGVGIVAALSKEAWEPGDESYYTKTNRVSPSGDYATLQGTSMAAPATTGAVALLLQQALLDNAPMTPDAIKVYLQNGARTDSYTTSMTPNDFGHGKVDVKGALAALAEMQPAPPAENQAPIANAGPDQTVTDNNKDGSETVKLNGSASSDTDGSIDSYQWTNDLGEVIGTDVSVIVTVPTGQTKKFTLTVTDDDDASSEPDDVSVTVKPGKGKPSR